jgi:Mce-associated membrane protein
VSPNLYDLLDVEESASRDEVRAAWQAATRDLDPTDRRFRAYNDAAAVLLDDDKRAAYDAELAAARAEDEPDGAPVPAATAAETAPVRDVTDGKDPDGEDTVPADSAAADSASAGDAAPAGRGPSWAVVAPVVAVAVLSIALLLWIWLLPGGHSDVSPHDLQQQAGTAEQAGRSAQQAASEMVPVVLAYDYRTFDEDEAKARAYLTDDFAAQRTKLLEGLKKDVVKGKVTVNATASATGLTRVSDDGTRAQVVVYVDQESRHGDSAPQPLHMWATFTLVKGDDGDWLLDGICTDQDCT